jgi:hypothetical protein
VIQNSIDVIQAKIDLIHRTTLLKPVGSQLASDWHDEQSGLVTIGFWIHRSSRSSNSQCHAARGDRPETCAGFDFSGFLAKAGHGLIGWESRSQPDVCLGGGG